MVSSIIRGSPFVSRTVCFNDSVDTHLWPMLLRSTKEARVALVNRKLFLTPGDPQLTNYIPDIVGIPCVLQFYYERKRVFFLVILTAPKKKRNPTPFRKSCISLTAPDRPRYNRGKNKTKHPTTKKTRCCPEPAKNWTRSVIYISIFQVFHPTDVEKEVSKRFLSSIRRWSPFFCQLEQYFAKIFVILLTIIADLAMIVPLTTWNLLDFRVAEKKTLLKQDLFAQPWWSRLCSFSLSCNFYFESY